MAESQRNKVEETLWQKNLLLLSQHYPSLYRKFIRYTPKNDSLAAILRQENPAEKIVAYESRTEIENRVDQEVAQFLSESDQVGEFTSVIPSLSTHDIGKRYFNQYKSELVGDPLFLSSDMDQVPKLSDHIPCLVILGIGMGLHIEKIIDRVDVHTVTIFEIDPDNFFKSLFVVDWSRIVLPFLSRRQCTFTWIIGYGQDSRVDVYGRLLYLHLIRSTPSFPLLTKFFIDRCEETSEQSLEIYHQIYRYCQDSVATAYATWGNYDDELYQLNQAKYNVHGNIPTLLPKGFNTNQSGVIGEGEDLIRPVILVGAGPSLDTHIDSLRSMLAFSIVISCGSAITALHAYGIKPDIHVESESDYGITYQYLTSLNDFSYLKGVELIAPLHMNPLVVDLFGGVTLYRKQGCTVSAMFEDSKLVLQGTAPTCLNAAFGVSVALGFSTVYLFGTDLGFSSTEEHHSQRSIYYDKEADSCFSDSVSYVKENLLEVVSVEDQKILTNAFYYTTKIKLEESIAENSDWIQVFNCSDGAKISGTIWLGREGFNDHRSSFHSLSERHSDEDKNKQLQELLDRRSLRSEGAAKEFASAVKDTERSLLDIYHDIESILMSHRCSEVTEKEVHLMVLDMEWYIENILRKRRLATYNLVRGSLWYLCFLLLYAFYFKGVDRVQKEVFFNRWLTTVKLFLQGLSSHFGNCMYRELDKQTDQWLYQSITDPE